MNLLELQEWVRADWEQHSPVRPDPHMQLLYLFEELGEMAEAIRQRSGQKEHATHTTDLGEEMGDVLVALATVANNYQVDLEEAFEKARAKIEARHKLGTEA